MCWWILLIISLSLSSAICYDLLWFNIKAGGIAPKYVQYISIVPTLRYWGPSWILNYIFICLFFHCGTDCNTAWTSWPSIICLHSNWLKKPWISRYLICNTYIPWNRAFLVVWPTTNIIWLYPVLCLSLLTKQLYTTKHHKTMQSILLLSLFIFLFIYFLYYAKYVLYFSAKFFAIYYKPKYFHTMKC